MIQSLIVSAILQHLPNLQACAKSLPNIEIRSRVFASAESPEVSSWLDRRLIMVIIVVIVECDDHIHDNDGKRQ